ncbi:MarR family transcriptional regulator [Asanoa sp. NPDC049573]|uniref:MarR family winged helix-turn-helix transcriptional regulator n=1 Tax=Asanoa sp. NPDC049573 TaxID=3155396 RepID=UPI00342C19C7
MTPAEELRYLILAIQREGNRLYAADLRPLDLTPSQAEALRVLADHQPLSMSGLGELLVCETGDNPSRLVDRLVRTGLINREPDPTDRRHVTLTLTPAGGELAARVATVEERLHHTIETLITGQPVEQTLALLRTFANAFPAGQALARRREHRKGPPA